MKYIKMKLNLKTFDVVSLTIAVFAYHLHMVGMILPNWWVVDDFDVTHGVKVEYYYGIWLTKACVNGTCEKETASMEGERAWLIGAVVLVLLAALLLLAVLVMNVVYICRASIGPDLRKLCVVLSGGAGSISILAVVIFVKKKSGLIPSKAPETSDGDPGWTMYATIIAAILSVINAIIIAVGVTKNFRKGIKRDSSVPDLIVKEDSYYERLQQMLVEGQMNSVTADRLIKMAPENTSTSKMYKKRKGSVNYVDVNTHM